MTRLKLLIVDDAKFIRDLVQRTLKNEYPEIEITEAADGRKAQVALERYSFDMVLCDWEMPEMSGIELLHWIRQHERLSKLPFILITSLDQKENVVEALQAGVNDYITKPFSTEQLISKVIKHLVKSEVITPEQAAQMGRKERISSAGGAELLAANPLVNAGKTAPKKTKGSLGKALLLTGDKRLAVIIRAINAQEASLLSKISDGLPAIKEEVTLGLVVASEDATLKVPVKAYVSSLQLAERNPATDRLNIKVQFLPQDQETSTKFQQALTQLLT